MAADFCLFLRTFANCADESTAHSLRLRLCDALAAWRPTAAAEPKRYWKLPELYEFTFDLQPAKVAAFEQILSLVSYGWHHAWPDENERSSVWNRADGLVLLTPEVAWANLELFARGG
ncbi:hypothetical protein [Pelomonas sp. Root1444]|uniref:hypothetical protein n=1 Tax=Pelomonas sp. Root1444 TaxID=1736464 RepID=UPI000702FCBE|nr:hypothetical protein [Pelomonas sp. Root1444]KQY85584.1 hypothetical protein ASD35_23565 [Pelomonas sp. Root1444]